MSAAEIIAELPRLTPAELAEVQAKLSELVLPTRDGAASQTLATRAARICNPRLAHPGQSEDFVKQVVELGSDAKL